MSSAILNDQTIEKSPLYASQLKQLLKTGKDEAYFLDQLAELEKMRVAHEIARERKKKHWSQSDLAEKIGTTQAVVSRMEQGKVNFGFSLWVKLRAVLGINVS